MGTSECLCLPTNPYLSGVDKKSMILFGETEIFLEHKYDFKVSFPNTLYLVGSKLVSGDRRHNAKDVITQSGEIVKFIEGNGIIQ